MYGPTISAIYETPESLHLVRSSCPRILQDEFAPTGWPLITCSCVTRNVFDWSERHFSRTKAVGCAQDTLIFARCVCFTPHWKYFCAPPKRGKWASSPPSRRFHHKLYDSARAAHLLHGTSSFPDGFRRLHRGKSILAWRSQVGED